MQVHCVAHSIHSYPLIEDNSHYLLFGHTQFYHLNIESSHDVLWESSLVLINYNLELLSSTQGLLLMLCQTATGPDYIIQCSLNI